MLFKFPTHALLGALPALSLAGTTASIGLQSSVANPAADQTIRTVNYAANTEYEPCSCDRTYGTCDAHCCCDSECSFVSTRTFKSFRPPVPSGPTSKSAQTSTTQPRTGSL